MNRKRKNEKKRTSVLIILLLVLALGIGYALLNESLKINSSVNYDTIKWDVGFYSTSDGGGTVKSQPSVSSDKKTLTISCEVGTSTGQETCIAKATIYNDSTFSIKLSEAPNITYNNTYITSVTSAWEDGSGELSEDDKIDEGETKEVRFTVKTKALTEEMLPKETVLVPIKITLNWVESEPVDLSVNLFDSSDVTTGGIYHSDSGSWMELSGYTSTGFIPIKSNKTYFIWSNTTAQMHITFWDKDMNFMHGRRPGVVENEIQIKVPKSDSIAYMKIGVPNAQINSLNVSRQSHIDEEDITVWQTRLASTTNEANTGSQWNGKKWYAFGTSITSTAQGKYVDPLAQLSGMNATNKGVPGAGIANNIILQMTTTDYSSADIVTIEGFVNDWYGNFKLGKVGDKTLDTFAGSLYHVIKTAHLKSKGATIILITDSVGRKYNTSDFSETAVNGIGLTQMDYINMTVQVAEYMNVRCIQAGQNVDLTGDYYVDFIHHSDNGGQLYAQAIWNELSKVDPKK